jgi:hypothetical protein
VIGNSFWKALARQEQVYLILDGEVTKHSLEHWHPKDLQGTKRIPIVGLIGAN